MKTIMTDLICSRTGIRSDLTTHMSICYGINCIELIKICNGIEERLYTSKRFQLGLMYYIKLLVYFILDNTLY